MRLAFFLLFFIPTKQKGHPKGVCHAFFSEYEQRGSPRPKNSPPDCFCTATRCARASESMLYHPLPNEKSTSKVSVTRSFRSTNRGEVHALKTVPRTVFAPLRDVPGLPNPRWYPPLTKQKGHLKGVLFAWWGMVDSDHRRQSQQIYSLSPLTAREIPHMKFWSWWTDSNPRPADYKSAALPAELHQQTTGNVEIIA